MIWHDKLGKAERPEFPHELHVRVPLTRACEGTIASPTSFSPNGKSLEVLFQCLEVSSQGLVHLRGSWNFSKVKGRVDRFAGNCIFTVHSPC
jgi:hypothetical protein